MSKIQTGSCLCGEVKFRVDGPLREVVFCHCGQCRRQTGLYYASTNAAESDLTITGAENITWYQSSDEGRRGFCKHCGSALFWKYLGQDDISIQAGSLDKPTALTPGYHIFCADKGDFYAINDDLPQYAKSSPKLVTNSD
ncbi:GFA family protein [Rhizobium sp. TH2]|uniref:GFA family protein n=1 Tax=Rhizobium sp. TH2 TaxID=2775403 RepID=UPI00215835B8|nr:GFA family protein [Rhizobium sp. TH2]UVC11471.1 GFA family protein [Rhizobium sp. TH2]